MKSTEKAIRDFCGHHADWWPSTTQVQEMLALAQPAPVQEWMKPHPKCDEACIFQCTRGFTRFPECATTPPAAQRKPLTDEQMDRCIEAADTNWASAYVPIAWARHFAKAIEAAHGITEKGQL